MTTDKHCRNFRKFLDESENANDRDLPPALQEHLGGCSSCQREWQLQRRIFVALARAPELSPAFAGRVMMQLAAEPLPKRRFDFDMLLIAGLIPLALVALWFSTQTWRPRLLAAEKLPMIFTFIQKFAQDLLQTIVGSTQQLLLKAFGAEMLAQAGQFVFIALVTLLVAKSAVLIENHIRRMFNG